MLVLAKEIQSKRVKSSALLFPRLSNISDSPLYTFFKLLESFFLLCAKPAFTISQNFCSLIEVNIFLFILEIFIIAEFTFGIGEKYLLSTLAIIFGSPYALTDIDRMLSLLSLASILLATSCCTINTIISG